MKSTCFSLVLGLAVAAFAGCANTSGDKEGPEVKVPIEQVPAAVRATLAKESGGAAVKEADKEMQDGKTIYEADVIIGGKTYEIKVAEDGTLIGKTIDTEEDEKKDSGKKKD